jgi:hypothetical protein
MLLLSTALFTVPGCDGGGGYSFDLGDIDLTSLESEEIEKPCEAWQLPQMSPTGIVPEDGEYSFSQKGSFRVMSHSTGSFIQFSVEQRLFGAIPVIDGAFMNCFGQIGGTYCPSDSYGISGHFVTPTRAEGIIKYASDCQITTESPFVAEKR